MDVISQYAPNPIQVAIADVLDEIHLQEDMRNANQIPMRTGRIMPDGQIIWDDEAGTV